MPIKKMNKSELVNRLSNKLDIFTETDIEKSVSTILDFISISLSNNHRVEVRKFGTFSMRFRQKRLSRNPKTGTSLIVAAKSYPYFRASKDLKDSLNK